MTSSSTDLIPEFTLSCSSNGGPVTGFSCTNSDTNVTETGIAGLGDPSSTVDRRHAKYDLVVTVTGSKQGTYSCLASAEKFDGVGNPEPEHLLHPASRTIRVNGKEVICILLCCPYTPGDSDFAEPTPEASVSRKRRQAYFRF